MYSVVQQRVESILGGEQQVKKDLGGGGGEREGDGV